MSENPVSNEIYTLEGNYDNINGIHLAGFSISNDKKYIVSGTIKHIFNFF